MLDLDTVIIVIVASAIGCVVGLTWLLWGAARVIQDLVGQVGRLVDRVRLFETAHLDAPTARLGAKFGGGGSSAAVREQMAEVMRQIDHKAQADRAAVEAAEKARQAKLPKKGVKLGPADQAAGIRS